MTNELRARVADICDRLLAGTAANDDGFASIEEVRAGVDEPFASRSPVG